MNITIRPSDDRQVLIDLRVGTLITLREEVYMVIGGQYPWTHIAQIDTGTELRLSHPTKVRVVHIVDATFE